MTLAEENVALRRQVRELSEELEEYRRLRGDGGETVDPHIGRLQLAFGLTQNQAALIWRMARASGPVSIEALAASRIRRDVEVIDPKTVTVHVHQTRRKLARFGLGEAIRNLHGQGYYLEPRAPFLAAAQGAPSGGPATLQQTGQAAPASAAQGRRAHEADHRRIA